VLGFSSAPFPACYSAPSSTAGTSTVDLGGGLSAPSGSELSIPPKGAGYYLAAVDFSVSEDPTILSGPGSSATPGVLLPTISSSSPCKAFSGSPASAYSLTSSSFSHAIPTGVP
jgi:hypothetical protein